MLTAPITRPAEGALVFGTVTVGMSETGASGTPITFTLTVDGTQLFTTSGTASTASFDWNSKSVPDGSHTLGLTVQDGAGRTATDTRHIAVHQVLELLGQLLDKSLVVVEDLGPKQVRFRFLETIRS